MLLDAMPLLPSAPGFLDLTWASGRHQGQEGPSPALSIVP